MPARELADDRFHTFGVGSKADAPNDKVPFLNGLGWGQHRQRQKGAEEGLYYSKTLHCVLHNVHLLGPELNWVYVFSVENKMIFHPVVLFYPIRFLKPFAVR